MSDADLLALARNTQAIHNNESNGASDSAHIVNPASGAEGSMQVVKGTQKDPGFGVRPSDGTPEDTAREGRDYYAAMHVRYKDPITAAVAYNWGPGKADKWIANGAKLEDLPDETLKYIAKMHQQNSAAAPAPNTPEVAPTEPQNAPKTAPKPPQATTPAPTTQPAVPKPQQPGIWDKVVAAGDKADAWLLDNTKDAIAHPGKFADDAVRSIANTVTGGWADKIAAKADEKVLNKGNYSDNLKNERAKDDAQNGIATGLGTAAGMVVPVGIGGKIAKAAEVSRAGRVGLGIANGTAMGAIAGSGTAEEGQEGKGAIVGALTGGAVGGVLPAVMPATMNQKVAKFIKNSGGEEGARMDAEAIKDLSTLADNVNQRGKNLKAVQLNAVESKYVNDVAQPLRRSGSATPEIQDAVANRRGLTDAELASLKGTPEGDAIAASLDKASRLRGLTAQEQAAGGVRKLLRTGLDVYDQIPGVPNIPRALQHTAKNMLGGGQSREQVAQKLLKQEGVADEVMKRLGASKALNSINALEGHVANQQATQQMRLAGDRGLQQRAQGAADIASMSQGVMDNGLAAGAARRAQAAKDAAALAKTQKASDKLDGTLEKMRQAKRDVVDKAAQAAQFKSTYNDMAKASRMPQGGAFQTLLQGGESGLNLTRNQAVQDLRALSNHPTLGPHANELRHTGAISNEQGFYGVQNALRNLQESRGALTPTAPGALSNASSSYQEVVRQAGNALDRAISKAPNDSMSALAQHVASAKSQTLKQALIDGKLKDATPAEAKFIKDHVAPLAGFGKK
jgi:hypothetical protein